MDRGIVTEQQVLCRAMLIHEVIAKRRGLDDAPASLREMLAADSAKYGELTAALTQCTEAILAMIPADCLDSQGESPEMKRWMHRVDDLVWFMTVRGFTYGYDFDEAVIHE